MSSPSKFKERTSPNTHRFANVLKTMNVSLNVYGKHAPLDVTATGAGLKVYGKVELEEYRSSE